MSKKFKKFIILFVDIILIYFVITTVLPLISASKVVVENLSDYSVHKLTLIYYHHQSELIGTLNSHKSIKKKISIKGEDNLSLTYEFKDKPFSCGSAYMQQRGTFISFSINQDGSCKVKY